MNLPSTEGANTMSYSRIVQDGSGRDEALKRRNATVRKALGMAPQPKEETEKLENPIRVRRTRRGMSVRDLATETGLSEPYISQIEAGKEDASLAALEKIAETLRVDLNDLV
jgi:ribosome-binding protein aMBF1 (putative translation factor)